MCIYMSNWKINPIILKYYLKIKLKQHFINSTSNIPLKMQILR